MKPKKTERKKSTGKAAAKMADLAAPEKAEYPVSVYHAGVESLVFPTTRVSFADPQIGGYYARQNAAQNGEITRTDAAQNGEITRTNAAQNGQTTRTKKEKKEKTSQRKTTENRDITRTDATQNGEITRTKKNQKEKTSRRKNADINGDIARTNAAQNGSPVPPVLYARSLNEYDSPISPLIFLKPLNDYSSPLPPLVQTRLGETSKPSTEKHFICGKGENFFIRSIYSLKIKGFNSPTFKTRFHNGKEENSINSSKTDVNTTIFKTRFHNEKEENSINSSKTDVNTTIFKTRFHSVKEENSINSSKTDVNTTILKTRFHSGKGEDFFIPSVRSLKTNAFNSPLAPRERTQADDCKYQIPLLEEVGISGRERSPIPSISTLKTNAFNSSSSGADFQREYNTLIPSVSTLKTNEFNAPIPRLSNSKRKNGQKEYGSVIPSVSTLNTNAFNSLSTETPRKEFHSSVKSLSKLNTNAFNSLSNGAFGKEYNSNIPSLKETRKNQNNQSVPPLSNSKTDEYNASRTPKNQNNHSIRSLSNSNSDEYNSPIPPLSKIRSQSEFDSPIPPLAAVRAEAQPEECVSMLFSGGQKGAVRLPHKERQYYGPYVVEGDAMKDAPTEPVKPVPKIFTLIKHKPVIYNEFAIIFALFALAFGKTLMLKADFGVTAVQSIPYLLALYFDGISLGTWNLIVQGAYVLAAVFLSQKIKLRYLFAIGITLVYVFLLDVFVDFSAKIAVVGMNDRIICFAAGYFLSALSITFFFKGNMPLMPYETLEKEIAAKRKTSVVWVKIILDAVFFALATGLSFLLFGEIRKEALGVGTLVVMLTMSFAAAGINFVLNIFFTFRNLFLKTSKQYEDIGGFAIYSDI